MKAIDGASVVFRINPSEMSGADGSVITDLEAFADFMTGFELRTEDLLDPAILSIINGAVPPLVNMHMFYQHLMHMVVPLFYNVQHLKQLGGRFVLQIPDVADYTFSVFLGRVVVFNGSLSGEHPDPLVQSVQIRSDAFLAVLNDMLASLCERALENPELSADA